MAMNLASARPSQTDVAYRWSAFLLGFFMQFDLVPVAWHVPVQRISELPLLACVPLLVHRLLRRGNPLPTISYCMVILLFVVLHLAAGGVALSFGNANIDLSSTLIFAIYLIGGVGMYIILAQRSATGWFCWGLLIGALLSLVTFFMQANGMGSLAIHLGLSQAHQQGHVGGGGNGFTRLSGMWGHPNEVGHVLAISAPAAGYLFLSRRTYLPLALLALIVCTCFFFTANRGGIISVLVTTVMVVFAREEAGRAKRVSILFAILFLFVLAGALYLLPPPEFIYARFFEDNAASQNATGRMMTTLAGLGIAILHPFGMAYRDWVAAMTQASGFSTPHNGFISLAVALGVPFLLMYLGALVVVFLAGLRRPRKLSLDIFLMLVAVQASVSFMFEELADNDAFMILCGLLLARVYSGAVNLPDGRGGPVRVRRRREAAPRLADPQPAGRRA